jgi:fructokinase
MPERSTTSALCWGEVLWDLFPSGALLGGAPSNLAVHLAALQVPTTLVTRVGSDALGAQAKRELQDRGVDVSGVQIDSELATGRVGIALEGCEPRYTLHAGAWQRIACDASATELLRTTRAFCFGTLSQESEAGLGSWREALSHLPDDAIRFCDPNLRGGRIDPALVLEHMRAASVVKINEQEAATFEETYGCADATTWLLEEMDVTLVAKTLGPAGAVLRTKCEREFHGGFVASQGGDNVGAGDAFSAVLVLGVLTQAPLERIVEAANRYGSFVASSRGATPVPSPSMCQEIAEVLSCLTQRP